MEITFGICVSPNYDKSMLFQIIGSILQQDIPTYEIILIGDNLEIYDAAFEGVRIIPFDESVRPGWITRKKNLIAKEAKYENLCIVHDYLKLNDNWYQGVVKTDSEKEWDLMACRVWNLEGTRHADWNVSPLAMNDLIQRNPERYVQMLMKVAPHENHPMYVNALPYDVKDLTHIQYVSGGYIFCKTDVLRKVPFDENMIWGDPPGEDVVWAEHIHIRDYRLVWNSYSDVQILKPNKWAVTQMPYDFVEELRKHYV